MTAKKSHIYYWLHRVTVIEMSAPSTAHSLTVTQSSPLAVSVRDHAEIMYDRLLPDAHSPRCSQPSWDSASYAAREQVE